MVVNVRKHHLGEAAVMTAKDDTADPTGVAHCTAAALAE